MLKDLRIFFHSPRERKRERALFSSQYLVLVWQPNPRGKGNSFPQGSWRSTFGIMFSLRIFSCQTPYFWGVWNTLSPQIGFGSPLLKSTLIRPKPYLKILYLFSYRRKSKSEALEESSRIPYCYQTWPWVSFAVLVLYREIFIYFFLCWVGVETLCQP